jgi:hypothetical protein
MAAAEPRVSAGWRALIVLLGLACVTAAVFMSGFAAEAADSPDCDDRAAVETEIREEGDEASCWNRSGLKAVSVGLSWAAVAVLGLAALASIAVAATTRFGRFMLPLVGVAFALGALAIVVAAID